LAFDSVKSVDLRQKVIVIEAHLIGQGVILPHRSTLRNLLQRSRERTDSPLQMLVL